MQLFLIRFVAITGSFLFLSLFKLPGQMFFLTDTLELKPYTIESSRQKSMDAGSWTIKADSGLRALHEGNNLTTLLSSMAPLNLKYGGVSGALTTFSLRGAGGTRTLVTWNGIALNSMTTGDVNMSLLNASSFNEVVLNYSAPATLYGSNSFGGVLELNNISVFNEGFKIWGQQKAGSFSTFKTATSLSYSDKTMSHSTQYWYNTSRNNFTYFDMYYDETMKRQNAAHTNRGVISTHSFRTGTSHMLSGSIWYQDNQSGLPTANGNHPNLIINTQNDASLRTFLKWVIDKRNSYVSIKGFYFNEDFLYTSVNRQHHDEYIIYSDINTAKLGSEANFRHRFTHWLTADFGAVYTRLTAWGNQFTDTAEDNLALLSAVKMDFGPLRISGSARKEFHSRYDPPLRFGSGLEYDLIPNFITLRGAVNQKFRVPTFNEKYWPGSGVPDIKPERGTTSEAGFSLKHTVSFVTLSADANAYYNTMQQMIFWQPAINGLWKPENIQNALSKGLENRIAIEFDISDQLNIEQKMAFDLNRTYERGSDGRQLVYTPKYRANSTTSASFYRFNLLFNVSYVSRRYYDSSKYSLPEFFRSDIITKYAFISGSLQIDVSLELTNVFNQQEPYVKDFPVPGRGYLAGITIRKN